MTSVSLLTSSQAPTSFGANFYCISLRYKRLRDILFAAQTFDYVELAGELTFDVPFHLAL